MLSTAAESGQTATSSSLSYRLKLYAVSLGFDRDAKIRCVALGYQKMHSSSVVVDDL